jgi:hypothetical protein
MKNTKTLLALLLILLGVGGGYFLLNKSFATAPKTSDVVQELKATLSVDNGTNPQSFDVSQFVGKTALEATEGVAKIETSGEGANAFITTINERKADPKKNEFWELLINGESAQVGAGSYIVQNGDLIEWHINTF